MGDGNEVVNPDLGPEPELASRHFSETQDAKSEQGPLKRAGFHLWSVEEFIGLLPQLRMLRSAALYSGPLQKRVASKS